MTEHEQELFEIAGGERWLAEALPAAESVKTERIKLRIRVEVGEQWLSERLHDPSPRQMAETVREGVQAALRESPAVEPRNAFSAGIARGRWLATAGAALGLAAALAIAVIGVGRVENAATKKPLAASDGLNDEVELTTLSAFEQSDDDGDDVDQSLQELEKEIADLGQRFVGRRGDAETDTSFDELLDSMDSSDMDGEGVNQPVGAAWRIRQSGV